MDTRRLPFLLLVLLPALAQADTHNIECFVGASPKNRDSGALRASCAGRVPDTKNLAQVATGVPAAKDDTKDDTKKDDTKKYKGSMFVVLETAEYFGEKDAGKGLDGWLLGLRYRFRGQGRFEPFVHVLGGYQRPSRRNSTDAEPDWAAAYAAGGGIDVELNSMQVIGVVPALRLQLDVADSGATSGFDPHGRATLGLSLRFEGKHP
jgi:hypothetical protein